MKWLGWLQPVDWVIKSRGSQEGKWAVLFGCCLLMIGGGAALMWSSLAFHLFSSPAAPNPSLPFACYYLVVWPVLAYVLGILVGLPGGALLDNCLGPRLPCILGSCLSFSACMGGSFAVHNLWSILFCFGLLNGMGFGLLLFPASTAALRWGTRSLHTISTLKGTAYLAGFVLFAPMATTVMANTHTTAAQRKYFGHLKAVLSLQKP